MKYLYIALIAGMLGIALLDSGKQLKELETYKAQHPPCNVTQPQHQE